MRWLLWKDYRHNRPVVIAGLFFLLAPYLIVLGVIFWPTRPELGRWREFFAAAAIYSLCFSQLTVAVIGGNAIAGERVDRSAEFLASLPITRGRILASKLLLSLAIIAAIWLFNAIPLCCWYPLACPEPNAYQDGLRILACTALTGLLFFGVAWFLSSMFASPTFSICGALAVPLVFFATISFIAYLLGTERWLDLYAGFFYTIFCLSVAPACFGVGTWYYLRRVEP